MAFPEQAGGPPPVEDVRKRNGLGASLYEMSAEQLYDRLIQIEEKLLELGREEYGQFFGKLDLYESNLAQLEGMEKKKHPKLEQHKRRVADLIAQFEADVKALQEGPYQVADAVVAPEVLEEDDEEVSPYSIEGITGFPGAGHGFGEYGEDAEKQYADLLDKESSLIPKALHGMLRLEVNRAPKTEVPDDKEIIGGQRVRSGEMYVENGQVMITTAKGDYPVREIYQNIDGSYTIDATEYEFITEGAGEEQPEQGAVEQVPPGLASALGEENENVYTPDASEEYDDGYRIEEPQYPVGEQIIYRRFGETPSDNEQTPGARGETLTDTEARLQLRRVQLEQAGLSPEEIEMRLMIANPREAMDNVGLVSAVDELLGGMKGGDVNPAIFAEISQRAGLPVETIQALVTETQSRLREEALRQVRAQESTGKKIAKVGIKAVAYGALLASAASLGPLALVGVAGMRMGETYLSNKKEERAVEAQYNQLLDNFSSEEFLRDFVSALSTKQQEFIRDAGPETAGIQEGIEAAANPENSSSARRAHEQGFWTQVMDKHRAIFEDAKATLRAQNPEAGDDQIEHMARTIAGMYKLDIVTEFESSKFRQRNKGLFERLSQGIKGNKATASFREAYWKLSQRVGGEKALTVGIFAGAGILARETPIVRDILMGYGGFKAGEGIGQFFAQKDLERLRSITSQELAQDERFRTRARSQMEDPRFKQDNPVEYQRLRKMLDDIDQQRMLEVQAELTNPQEKQARVFAYIQNNESRLRNEFLEKTEAAKRERAKVWLGRLAGAGLAVVGGRALVDMFNAPQPEVAPVVPFEISIEKGQGITQAIMSNFEKGSIPDDLAQNYIVRQMELFQEAVNNGQVSSGLRDTLLARMQSASGANEQFKVATDMFGVLHRGADLQFIGDTFTITPEGDVANFITRGVELKGAVAADAASVINAPNALPDIAPEAIASTTAGQTEIIEPSGPASFAETASSEQPKRFPRLRKWFGRSNT